MKLVDDNMEYVEVPARVAAGINHLMNISKLQSTEGRVETDKDWWILEEVIKVYATMYPVDFSRFLESVKYIRESSTNQVAKEAGGAEIRRTLELPQKLYEMLLTMFPKLKFDTEFVQKFATKIPLFSVVDKI